MKKTILFFSLILIHCTIFGQDIRFSDLKIYKNIDSLETLVKKQSVNTSLVNLLSLELSYYWSSSAKQGSLIENIEKEGLKSKSASVLASAKYFRGLQAMKESKMAYAATLFLEALKQFETLHDKSGIIHCSASMSMLNFDGNNKVLGDIQPAQYYRDVANNLAQRSNIANDNIISAFASIIYDYANQNSNSHQMNFRLAQRIIKENPQLIICNSKIKIVEAMILHKKGEFMKSANIYETLLLNTPQSNHNARITYLFNLGNDFFSMKSYQKATLSYQNAIRTFHKSGQSYHLRMIDIFTNWRAILVINQEYNKANNLADSILKYREFSEINSQQKLLTDLELKYQSEKKGQEIALIKKEKALVNTKNRLISHQNEALKNYLFLISMIVISLIISLFLIIKQNKKIKQITLDRDKFFTILAHDLRSPIQAFTKIGATVRFLITNKRTSDVNQMLDNLDLQSTNLAQLTDNILYWGLFQNFGFIINLKPENLSNYLEDICLNTLPMLKLKNISLTKEIPSNIICKTDTKLTNILIRNLLDNAIKFNTDNGHISIIVQNLEAYVKIIIKNTGEPMPPEKIDLLNSIFSRKIVTNVGEKNIGLGTYIIAECTNKLNSNINVRNMGNTYTVFTLNINKNEST